MICCFLYFQLLLEYANYKLTTVDDADKNFWELFVVAVEQAWNSGIQLEVDVSI